MTLRLSVVQEISAASAEARASKILHGLGFNEAMLRRATRDFSGGKLVPVLHASSSWLWFIKEW